MLFLSEGLHYARQTVAMDKRQSSSVVKLAATSG